MTAALLAASALLELLRALLRSREPFAAAPRIAGRVLKTQPSGGGEWRRYVASDGLVELGPFAAGVPQKILLVARFETDEEAFAFADEIRLALPPSPQPMFPAAPHAPFCYRGSIVIERRPIGLEVRLDDDCRITVILIAGGPRVLVPQ